jgi:hypothetical protein
MSYPSLGNGQTDAAGGTRTAALGVDGAAMRLSSGAASLAVRTQIFQRIEAQMLSISTKGRNSPLDVLQPQSSSSAIGRLIGCTDQAPNIENKAL